MRPEHAAATRLSQRIQHSADRGQGATDALGGEHLGHLLGSDWSGQRPSAGRATSSEVFGAGPNASLHRGGCAPVRLSRSASCGGRRGSERPRSMPRRPSHSLKPKRTSCCARIWCRTGSANASGDQRAVDTRRGNSFSRTSANAISSWSLKPGLGTHVESARVRPDAMRVPRVQFETFEQRQDGCPEDLKDGRAEEHVAPQISRAPRSGSHSRGRSRWFLHRGPTCFRRRPHRFRRTPPSTPGLAAEGSPCSKRWTYSSAGRSLALGAMHVLDHHRGLERPCCERPKTGLMKSPSWPRSIDSR